MLGVNRAAWVMSIFFVFPATMPAQDVRPTYPGYLFLARKGFEVFADAALREVFISAHPALEYPYEGRRNYWSGAGLYRAYVTPGGKVTDVEFSRAQAIRRWTQR